MNKDFLESMDYSRKIHFALMLNEPDVSIMASFAYARLEMHETAASMQMQRIWDDIRAMNQNRQPEPDIQDTKEMLKYFAVGIKLSTPLYIDIHYYFSAWDNIGKMMAALSSPPVFLEARKIYTSHIKDLEHYRAARNTFEHYDERLPTKKHQERVRGVAESPGSNPVKKYGGISKDGFYEFSDMRWDIKPSSLHLLRGIVSEFKQKIHKKVDILLTE